MCISDALTLVETTKERWYEAEVSRIAGEIALLAPERYTIGDCADLDAALSRVAKAVS